MPEQHHLGQMVATNAISPIFADNGATESMSQTTTHYDLDSLLKLINSWGAKEVAHSGRTLLDHLFGVHNLLAEWGAAPKLCLAGLFHSIYGTALPQ